jgi:hypothetical protein
MRKLLVIPLVAVVAALFALPASAEPPSREAAIYADGEAFSTKFATLLPAPNDHNAQSYDLLYTFRGDTADGQLPVAEAAPGPGFNGGRWASQTVEWDADVIDPPRLTSSADVLHYEDLGLLTITAGHANPTGPDYFLCPLFPVR